MCNLWESHDSMHNSLRITGTTQLFIYIKKTWIHERSGNSLLCKKFPSHYTFCSCDVTSKLDFLQINRVKGVLFSFVIMNGILMTE